MKSEIHKNKSVKETRVCKTITRIIATLVFASVIGLGAYAQNTTCQASFTYTVGPNGQVSFTNTSTGTSSTTNYTWTWQGWSGYGSSYAQSPTFNFNYNGTYWVYLNISDSLTGCQSWASDTIVINNAQPCQVSFTYTIGSNGQVSFNNTSQGNVNYYWNFGDGNTSTQTSPSNIYLYNGTYTVYVWADTVGGYCGGYSQAVITISNAAPCNMNASFTTNTNGSGVFVFTDTVTTNPTSTAHTWSVNGIVVGYGNPFTYVFNSNGTFNVCETVSDSALMGGCGDTACTNVTVGGLTCNDSAFFYLYPDSSQQGNWYAWLYSSNYNSLINAVWSWGDGTSSTGLYPTHTYQNPGWYSICVTAYFACGDTSTYCETDSLYRTSAQMVTINVVNGANSVHADQQSMTSFKAYPNPFADDLTVKLSSYENQDITCSLFDMMGNVLLQENVEVIKGDNVFKLKTGDIGKGVYFIHISSNGRTSILKVIK